jgi:hypothetical protein
MVSPITTNIGLSAAVASSSGKESATQRAAAIQPSTLAQISQAGQESAGRQLSKASNDENRAPGSIKKVEKNFQSQKNAPSDSSTKSNEPGSKGDRVDVMA